MQNTAVNKNGEMTMAELFQKTGMAFRHLFKQWWKLLVAAGIGLVIGLIYSIYTPIKYKAEVHFMVEESKGGGGAGIAALAGQFGFDLGSLGGSGGLLSGDNILIFLKSKSLIKETLLTPYDSTGSISLADRYAETKNLKNKWLENYKINQKINFPINSAVPYSRLQDSLLHVIVNQLIEKELMVDKPDKKASFILVSTSLRDELLSKYFCERLVKNATDRYVTAKTVRQSTNVQRLQRRADSISALLNNRTYSSALAQEHIIDINPGLKSPMVNAEVAGRDKMMLATIYGEVVKNLEISKVALSQETPTIQIIDEPELPLKLIKVSKPLAGAFGAIILTVACAVYLFGTYFFRNRIEA